MSKTMRVTENSFKTLDILQEETGKSKQDIIELALKELSRKLFFNKIKHEYSKLKKNNKEWEDYLSDRQEWESLINNIEEHE